MLGLPSTTEVGKRIPKEAFYRHYQLDKRTRIEFVSLIDRIAIANTIKPETANIADGAKVHEILVVAIDLKGAVVPKRAIEAIARITDCRVIFRIEPSVGTFVVHEGLQFSDTITQITLNGANLDDVWDSIVAQIAFNDANGKDIDARIIRAKQVAALEKEVALLDSRCRKERQISRKNELFEKLQNKEAELKTLKEGK